MNKELIDELQALLDAGTQGEWIFDETFLHSESEDDSAIACVYKAKDRPLILALHNHAPALLEAAKENLRLRENLVIARKGLAYIRDKSESQSVTRIHIADIAKNALLKSGGPITLVETFGKETV
jgi:hypothetical protein